MADLTDLTGAQNVKLTGSDASGVEQAYIRNIVNDLGVADVLTSTGTQGTITVGTSAVEAKVGGAALTNRKILTVQPAGNIFCGFSSGVTTSTGFTIYKDAVAIFDVSETGKIYLIATGNTSVKIGESL